MRHPIYTGILAGFFVVAIAISDVRGFIVVLIFLVFWFKLSMEGDGCASSLERRMPLMSVGAPPWCLNLL